MTDAELAEIEARDGEWMIDPAAVAATMHSSATMFERGYCNAAADRRALLAHVKLLEARLGEALAKPSRTGGAS